MLNREYHSLLSSSIVLSTFSPNPCLLRKILIFFFSFSPKSGKRCPKVWKMIYGFW